MSNILVIADQPRIQQMSADALNGAAANVKLVGSLKLAEEVANDFPHMLLIQDRLSGLSGEILARHLRNIFPCDGIAVILLTDERASSVNSRFIDRYIDLRGSDADIAQAIREAIARLKKKDPPKTATTSLPTTDTLKVTVEDRVGIESAHQQEKALPTPTPFGNSFENALNEQNHVPLPVAVTELELANRQRHAAEGLLARAPKRQFNWLWVLVPIALTTYYLSAGEKTAPAKKPAASPVVAPARPAPPPGIATLPSFIPAEGLDPGFAKRNPGWDRHIDSSKEYKVFRRGAAIVALQVIDHSGTGLSAGFIERALQEMTRNKSYTITGTSAKEGFIVEKGTAANNAKIIIYKRQSDRQVRGMVLHFD